MSPRNQIVVRNGYMKFLRLGPLKFGKQGRWKLKAPRNKGLWAFPYPFYDEAYVYHKYLDLLPKHLRSENIDDAGESEGLFERQEEWVREVGKKILPLREFWYSGYVHTYFGGDNHHNDEWTLMDTEQLAKTIRKTGGNSLYEKSQDGSMNSIATGVSHLEVFLAPGHGTIKEGRKTNLAS